MAQNGHGPISDLSPLCAPKRTPGDHSKFMGSRPRWRGRARWRSCSCGVVRAPVPAPPIQLESAHSGQPSGLAVPARSGREWNLLSPSCGDLPVGQFCVESRLQKYFGFHAPQITSRTPLSHPTRGAYRDRHERGEGCGGRGSVRRAT